jgi:hypothetical protein
MKTKTIFKIIFTIFSSVLFLYFTKIKFGPILGTSMKFSLSVFFGPTLANIFGVAYGTSTIILTHILGLIAGFFWPGAKYIYKIKALKDYFTFLPIIFAGIYFSRIFKRDKRLIVIPLICILLFILNPIGRTVWFYSAFWLIPILISLFKEKLDKILRFPLFKIYGYSLGTAFVDHAIGSVVFLYLLKIPANFWVEAIPMTIVERLMIAAGIELFYFAELVIIKAFGKIPVLSKIKSFVFENN